MRCSLPLDELVWLHTKLLVQRNGGNFGVAIETVPYLPETREGSKKGSRNIADRRQIPTSDYQNDE